MIDWGILWANRFKPQAGAGLFNEVHVKLIGKFQARVAFANYSV